MPMSAEEISLAREFVGQLGNVTHSLTDSMTSVGSLGFDIMVKGTMISGFASIICTCLWIISVVIGWKMSTKYMDTKDANDDDKFLISVVMTIATGFVMVFAIKILHSGIIALLAPEYVVANNLLDILK